jgi:hypothetical protein
MRIPPRVDEKAWQELRAAIREERLFALERAEQMSVRRRHELERRIADLELRPSSEARAKTLHLLRTKLASL